MLAQKPRTQSLPYTWKQARLMKVFGLHSQWTTFSYSNADVLTAIAHLAQDHAAPCHMLIHARSNKLASTTPGLTVLAQAALQLSISAVALACLVRKAAAAKQLLTTVEAFAFCQRAIKSYERGMAQGQVRSLQMTGVGKCVQAILVLIKLYSFHAVQPSPDVTNLQQAASALSSLHQHLLWASKHAKCLWYADGVEECCILAVMTAQTALDMLRQALRGRTAKPHLTTTCACVALNAMLRNETVPHAATQAASTLVDSGMPVLVALLKNEQETQSLAVCIISSLFFDTRLPDSIMNAAGALLLQLQAVHPLIGYLTHISKSSLHAGQTGTKKGTGSNPDEALPAATDLQVCGIIQRLLSHQTIPPDPLTPLPTPSPASWKLTQSSVIRVSMLMEVLERGSYGGAEGAASGAALWAIIAGLLTGHLSNMRLNIKEVAKHLLPQVWSCQIQGTATRHVTELGLALMGRLARDASVLQVTDPMCYFYNKGACQGCDNCSHLDSYWQIQAVKLLPTVLINSAHRGNFRQAALTASALFVAIDNNAQREVLLRHINKDQDLKIGLKLILNPAAPPTLEIKLTVLACLATLDVQEIISIQNYQQCEVENASVDLDTLLQGLAFIFMGIETAVPWSSDHCVALIRAMHKLGKLQAAWKSVPGKLIGRTLPSAAKLLLKIPTVSSSSKLKEQLLQATVCFMRCAWHIKLQQQNYDMWPQDFDRLPVGIIDVLEMLPRIAVEPAATAAAATTTAVPHSEAGLPNLASSALLPYVLKDLELCHRNAAVVAYFGQHAFPPIAVWLDAMMKNCKGLEDYTNLTSTQVQMCVYCIGSYGSKVPNWRNVTPPPAEGFEALVQLTLWLAQNAIDSKQQAQKLRTAIKSTDDKAAKMQKTADLYKVDLAYVLKTAELMHSDPIWWPVLRSTDWRFCLNTVDPTSPIPANEWDEKLTRRRHFLRLQKSTLLSERFRQRLSDLYLRLGYDRKDTKQPDGPDSTEAAAEEAVLDEETKELLIQKADALKALEEAEKAGAAQKAVEEAAKVAAEEAAAEAAEARAAAAANKLLWEEARAARKATTKKIKKAKQKAKKTEKRRSEAESLLQALTPDSESDSSPEKLNSPPLSAASPEADSPVDCSQALALDKQPELTSTSTMDEQSGSMSAASSSEDPQSPLSMPERIRRMTLSALQRNEARKSQQGIFQAIKEVRRELELRRRSESSKEPADQSATTHSRSDSPSQSPSPGPSPSHSHTQSRSHIPSPPHRHSHSPTHRPSTQLGSSKAVEQMQDLSLADDSAAAEPISDNCSTVQSDDSLSLETLFCCPLTKAMMSEPVIAADGHTYERAAIALWLHCNTTSPVTGLPLPHCRIVPNLAIRNAIQASR